MRLLSVGTKFGSTWMEAAQKSPNWEIAGCVAKTKKSLTEAAEKYDINEKYLYTDLETAIKSTPDLDAVVIATPNEYHYELAKIVLKNDLNLILEKPITETWEQALDLVHILDRHPMRKAMVGQTLRGDISMRLMEQKLNEGIIGNIEQITFQAYWNYIDDPNQSWRFRLENLYLDDIGIHQIDTIRMLTGNKKCKRLFAQTSTPGSYPLKHIKTNVSAILEMEDNINVNFFGTMASKGEQIGWYGIIKVFGENGTVFKEPYGKPYVVFEGKKERIVVDAINSTENLPLLEYEKIPYLLEDFYYAINENRSPKTDLHDNLNSHAILLGMKKSAEKNSIIEIQKEFPINPILQ